MLFFYANSERRLKFLIASVIAVGTGSAIFGILRDVFLDAQNGLLSGYLLPDQGYAQFINRNHFAFLIEMAFGLLLGLLIKGELSERSRFIGWIISAIMLYSLISSNSRGGLIGLLGLSLFAVFVHVTTRHDPIEPYLGRQHQLIGGWVRKLVLATGLGSAYRGPDSGHYRFCRRRHGRFPDRKAPGRGRGGEHRKDRSKRDLECHVELISERPMLGAGFGAYAAAIPKYDSTGGMLSLQQAHNDYLEILAKAVLPGSHCSPFSG